jgi:hypothetical protein
MIDLAIAILTAVANPENAIPACPDPLEWLPVEIPVPAGGTSAWPDEIVTIRAQFFLEDGVAQRIDIGPPLDGWRSVMWSANRLRFPAGASGICYIEYVIDYPAMKAAASEKAG